jgi:RNA polymerase sigma-70 factor, ECF subfamily
MTDREQLLERGRAGDRSALSSLIEAHQAAVAAFVASRLRSAGTDVSHCEDLCQAIFVKMVLGLPRLRTLVTFEGWLFQIARNVCRDHLRRQRWRRRLFAPWNWRHLEVAEMVGPHVELESTELEHAIAQLDAGDRTLLELTLERPRSYAELAAALGITIAATKSRLFRTRARLGELLKQGGPVDEP